MKAVISGKELCVCVCVCAFADNDACASRFVRSQHHLGKLQGGVQAMLRNPASLPWRMRKLGGELLCLESSLWLCLCIGISAK